MAALALILTTGTGYAMQAEWLTGGSEQASLHICAPPGDTGRLFIVGADGKIKFVKLPQQTINPIPFLDLSGIVSAGGEQGLLGMAFDPNYATNGRFYVSYHARRSFRRMRRPHFGVFRSRRIPMCADPGSRSGTVRGRSSARPTSNAHDGFWPAPPGDEGNLYIASGDGGGFMRRRSWPCARRKRTKHANFVR